MAKLREDRSKQCDNCSRKTNIKNNLCSRCERKITLKNVPTSSDYHLSKDDWLMNAMCFIHACGVLEEFMEKMDSMNPQLMMNTWSNGPGVIENILDSTLLDEYDEKSLNRAYKGFFLSLIHI